MIVRLVLCVAFWACLYEVGAAAEASQWFVIAGSHKMVQPALAMQQQLQPSWPQVTVVASSDCQNLRPGLYLTVVQSAERLERTQEAIRTLRAHIPDAYTRECVPKAYSRLFFGLPLLDPSIAKVPGTVVNWTDDDRLSYLVKFPGEGYLWIVRRYVGDHEDPREGRRESIFFFAKTPQEAIQLEADCTDPSYAQKGKWVALSCARESAAEQVLHQTKIFEIASGKVFHSESRCRKPAFVSAAEFTCQAEDIDKAGKLRLTSKRVRFG